MNSDKKEPSIRPDTPLVVVCGPTASGKTGLAVDLAAEFDGEVVSADSMQIYRRMNIGTAKPDQAEMCGIPHHLMDFLDPDRTFSLAEYLSLARNAISDIDARGKLPILAGGTGLYIHSLIDHVILDEIPRDTRYRQDLIQQIQQHGEDWLWQQLSVCDPALALKLHPNDKTRIIRALEVYKNTGIPMSEHQKASRNQASPYRLLMLGLGFRNRQNLYSRIDCRVDKMICSGFVEEVRSLRETGLSPTAVQAIGYRELAEYLDGNRSLEDAVLSIKQATRRYAKRQLTWLRRDERIHWLYHEDYNGYEELSAQACRLCSAFLYNDS